MKSPAKTRILFVDDDSEIRGLFFDFFCELKYEVITSENGKLAWDIIRTSNIDIVISDISMPEIDGIELCKLVRDAGLEIPFIFFTGNHQESRLINCLRLGADDYFVKPDSFTEINEALLKATAKNREATISNRIHSIFISTIYSSSEKIDRILKLGCQQLKMEFGILFTEKIFNQANSFVHDARLNMDGEIPLNGILVDIIENLNLAQVSMVKPEFSLNALIGADGALWKKSKYIPKSFIGVPMHAAAKFYGYLAFFGAKERFDMISNTDRSLIQQISVFLCALIELNSNDKMQVEHRKFIESTQKISMIGKVSTGIVHEIRNCLTLIIGRTKQLSRIVGNLSDDLGEKTKLIDLANSIISDSNRINGIVNSVQALFDDDNSKNIKENISVCRILEEVSELCNQKTEKNGIELKIYFPSADLIVEAHHIQILQVLVNLINNSCDAILDLSEKWIEVNVIVDLTRICIAVTDSGNGIPIEIREQIFLPFFTTKVSGLSNGIGLHLVQKIAHSHKGRLWLDVNSPRTRFVFEIPRNIQNN